MALNYQQALDYIHSFDDPYLAALRDHGHQTWGMERIEHVLGKLGNPHRAVPIIHVAGTKGKGSTAAFITQGLIESGLKTGLYISPHLEDWRERIQIDRALIAAGSLARLVEDFRAAASGETSLSAFEVTTALAFWHFARERCDVAVIEVGLGGRLDATNVVEPLVSVITSISLDHTQLLGETLAQIAAEKAAIIKPGAPVVSAPQPPEALAVIEAQAQEVGSPLTLVGRDFVIDQVRLTWQGAEAMMGAPGQLQRVEISLPGEFQVENAATAVAALERARDSGLAVTREGMLSGLSKVAWPGRLEVISRDPLIVVDSAHNPYSVQQLIHSLELLGGFRSLIVVFGSMADKDVRGMLKALLQAARQIIFTQGSNLRAAPAETLLALARELQSEAQSAPEIGAVRLSTAPDLPTALEDARAALQPGDAQCITGSLALAGEARTILTGSQEVG